MLLILCFVQLQAAVADVDPRGPIVSVVGRQKLVAKVSPGRVEAGQFDFDPRGIPDRPGAAGWIWLGGDRRPGTPPTAARFRKEIDLPAAPTQAQAWFTADAHARIYVNGRLVARGPDDGGQDYPGTQTGKWFVDYRDLTPFFHRGRNVIAAEVFSARVMEGRYNSTGRGGFLFEASLRMPNGTTEPLCSDATWRGAPASEWQFARWNGKDEALQFDAAAEPAGWRMAGFDDSHWQTCDAPKENWPPFETSQIPPRLEATYPWHEVVHPTRAVRRHGRQILFEGDGSCAVRFDRVISGFIGLKVRGRAGAQLVIQANEPNAPGYNRMASVLLRDGVQAFELPFYDGFSVINVTAKNVRAPLEILDVRANFVAQPVRYEGAFSCSDERLNRIWNTSRWLTEICQQTHHLDSPDHQEPICDPGDYLIISLNNYCAFGQPYLARQDLRKYAWLLRATKFRPFHTSYALLWLQMLMAYWDYTGDVSLVRELAPVVHDLLDQFATYRGKNGLLSEAPDYMFMDWVTIAGFGAHHPPAVIGQGYMTAFYYRALADGLRVTEVTGDSARSRKYEATRREILEAYNRELWDEKAGLYRDGKPFVTSVKPGDWLPADKDIETHSTQNNVLAVLYDLTPKSRQQDIMRRLFRADLNTQPYFMHFVFGALNHAGLFDEFGVSQMHRWKIVEDTQSFREMWATGDYSHAWQCTPLFQMSSRVLGITPASPGFQSVRICPQVCALKWAKGAMPTPYGKVPVSWTLSKSEFRLQAVIPQGVTATIELPVLGGDGASTLNIAPLSWGAGAHEAVVRIADK